MPLGEPSARILEETFRLEKKMKIEKKLKGEKKVQMNGKDMAKMF